MPTNTKLSPGFIPVTEAIDLIKAETRDNPRVDISRLAENLEYLQPRHNYTIFLLAKDSQGNIVSNGNKPIYIANDYEKALVEHTIIEKFEELSRQKYEKNKVRKITTSVTDADSGGNISGRPMVDTESKVQLGDTITDAR